MKLGERANVVVGYYNRGDRGIVTSPHVIAPSAILEPARRCESARLTLAQASSIRDRFLEASSGSPRLKTYPCKLLCILSYIAQY